MSKIFYNKLVRDKMREVVATDGNEAEFRFIYGEEYRAALEAKLQEEVAEYIESGEIEELADVLSVVLTLAQEFHSKTDIEGVESRKSRERGRFHRGLFMVWHESKNTEVVAGEEESPT